MAVDKLVDSTELDNGLTTIADAIRTKGGTSAPLAFPDGMAQAIADIEAGGAGGNYNIESVDDGNGGQILNITDAHGGGTEITAGMVFNAVDANGRPTEITFYGDVPENALGTVSKSSWESWLGALTTTVHFVNTTKIGSLAFSGSGITDLAIPDSVLSIGSSALRGCPNIANYKHENCGNGYGYGGAFLAALSSAKISNSIQFGAVGKPLTNFYKNALQQAAISTCVITAYCVGSNVDEFLTSMRNFATTQTIIFKASEATTYNGTVYAAGETMLTSEVA